MALGFIKDKVGGAYNAAKGAGSKVVDKAKDVGGDVIDKTKDVGGKVVDKAKDVGGKAKDIGGDVVNFSSEALEWKQKQEKNFANGVLEWGKGTVGTVKDIVTNPVESAKAVGKLATNPVLNPIGGTAAALVQGKNPVEAYGDGLKDLKDIGTGLYDGYKDVYKEHGIAGLAGNIAPDIAIALATGGSGTAARAGATTTGKAVAKEVVKDVAGEATTGKAVATGVAKDVAGELVPGPEDVVNEHRKSEEDKPNFLQALIDNFS